ncbi:kinesin-like protein KIF19 [Erinaceus europaeus]|uniref:Kinesin-like protein KIF19 n=1 Tax=Erinaceus europaeus TaxID=9365 RepID=A0ABM3W0K1_ERIEU|nr:kinesin-like protein KIF19 [Erinaceus europaeus]
MGQEDPKDQQLVVALRIRPLNEAELEEGASVITHKTGDQMLTLLDPSEDPEDTLRAHRSREKTFVFDMVFDEHATQEDVYCATTRHLVDGVLAGYNATVFAYGPSGAGKTFTMLGLDAQPGIYLQALSDLFRALEATGGQPDYSVSMSYLEIYNEVIRDLLNPASGCLELREDAHGTTQIPGITEASTSNAQEIMQLLTKANRQRTQEPTATNRTSSRSHAVLQVSVSRRGVQSTDEVSLGRLFLVDLAGSERASQTQNSGKRMKEGAHINRSLLALGNCIVALSERGSRQYVNFRDSKLTRLLKDALGGNSCTVMIAHISPASSHFEESRTTLLYAHRAKNIKTRVKRNLLSVSYHIAQYTDVISQLRREIEHLKAKIDKQEKERAPPGAPEPQAPAPARDTEEDQCQQLGRIRAQLIGAFREQLDLRRSLGGLESTLAELHVHLSRHLLTIADWERERTQQVHQEPGKDGDTQDGEGTEPHEVVLAREELMALLEEQRKTATLKAGLERQLAQAQRKASQLERVLPRRACSVEQREELRLLCRAHELELDRGHHLLHHQALLIRLGQRHRQLCECLIRDQRRLIQEAGLAVPEALEQRYQVYSRELGEGTLDRLLVLHSLMTSSLRDRSGLGMSPSPEEPSRELQADRKDLPWGARLQLPPTVLDSDGDSPECSEDVPSQKRDCLLPAASMRVLLTPPSHEKPDCLSVQNLMSKLCSPGSLDPGARLSPQALREMAASTRSIGRIAATRRSKAQDREAGSGPWLHPPAMEPRDSQGPSPADRRGPRGSPGRDTSVERTARKKHSPSFLGSGQPVGAAGRQQRDFRLLPPRPLPTTCWPPCSCSCPSVLGRASCPLSLRPPRSSPASAYRQTRAVSPSPALYGTVAVPPGRCSCHGMCEDPQTVGAATKARCCPATQEGSMVAVPSIPGDRSKGSSAGRSPSPERGPDSSLLALSVDKTSPTKSRVTVSEGECYSNTHEARPRLWGTHGLLEKPARGIGRARGVPPTTCPNVPL